MFLIKSIDENRIKNHVRFGVPVAEVMASTEVTTKLNTSSSTGATSPSANPTMINGGLL